MRSTMQRMRGALAALACLMVAVPPVSHVETFPSFLANEVTIDRSLCSGFMCTISSQNVGRPRPCPAIANRPSHLGRVSGTRFLVIALAMITDPTI